MKEERRKQMENLIAQRQNITMEELRSIFDVSMNTIRSDVAYLVESGAVEKVYGGVRIVPRQQVPLFVHRMNVATDAKRLIARCAESLINDGDKIYIDAGTTTMHLIDCLSPGKHVTVLTRSLYVMSRACENPNVELIDHREQPLDPWERLDEDTLEGTYLRLLRAKMNVNDPETSEIIQMAAEISRMLIEGKEVVL